LPGVMSVTALAGPPQKGHTRKFEAYARADELESK
jgi:hypothetical protein